MTFVLLSFSSPFFDCSIPLFPKSRFGDDGGGIEKFEHVSEESFFSQNGIYRIKKIGNVFCSDSFSQFAKIRVIRSFFQKLEPAEPLHRNIFLQDFFHLSIGVIFLELHQERFESFFNVYALGSGGRIEISIRGNKRIEIQKIFKFSENVIFFHHLFQNIFLIASYPGECVVFWFLHTFVLPVIPLL